MNKERKDESDEKERATDQRGKLDWHFLPPNDWPSTDSRNSRDQEMHKIFSVDIGSTDHLLAIYWG